VAAVVVTVRQAGHVPKRALTMLYGSVAAMLIGFTFWNVDNLYWYDLLFGNMMVSHGLDSDNLRSLRSSVQSLVLPWVPLPRPMAALFASAVTSPLQLHAWQVPSPILA
jgi:hypothetical protein